MQEFLFRVQVLLPALKEVDLVPLFIWHTAGKEELDRKTKKEKQVKLAIHRVSLT